MVEYPYPVSTAAVEPVGISFARTLPTGLTIASAEALLTAPDGTSELLTAVSVSSPVVTVTVGPFDQVGDWTLDVLATCSGGTPQPRLNLRITICVEYEDELA